MAIKVIGTTVIDDSRNIQNIGVATITSVLNVGTGGTVITTTVAGLVGIGITNPQNTLDVGVGTIRLINKSSTGRFSQIYQDGALNFKNSVVGDDFIFYGASNLIMRLNGSGELVIGTTNLTGTSSQRLQVTGGAYVSDNLGIGTTNPTSKLHVQGDAYITGGTTSTDFDSLSDFNLKTNIQQIDDSLAKVIQIRGVTFNWKETNRSSAGVIAQEVEKVLPELVNGEETKTVNYNGVIGALVEAVKELKVENDVLRERLDEVYKKVFG